MRAVPSQTVPSNPLHVDILDKVIQLNRRKDVPNSFKKPLPAYREQKRKRPVVVSPPRLPRNQVANRYRDRLVKRMTPAEQLFKAVLDRHKFCYTFQKIRKCGGKFYIADFMLTMNPKVVIELDGSSHDGREEYDADRTRRILAQKKYKIQDVIRFTNQEVYDGRAETVLRHMYPKQFARWR